MLTGIVFVAQLLRHGGPGAWATGTSSAFCFLIGAYSLFRGTRVFLRFDWLFLAAGLIALTSWFFVSDMVISVAIVTLVDVIGYAFTLRKGYYQPREDLATSFGLNCLKYVFALLALESYSLVTCLYPAALVIMNGLVVLVLATRRARPTAVAFRDVPARLR